MVSRHACVALMHWSSLRRLHALATVSSLSHSPSLRIPRAARGLGRAIRGCTPRGPSAPACVHPRRNGAGSIQTSCPARWPALGERLQRCHASPPRPARLSGRDGPTAPRTMAPPTGATSSARRWAPDRPGMESATPRRRRLPALHIIIRILTTCWKTF